MAIGRRLESVFTPLVLCAILALLPAITQAGALTGKVFDRSDGTALAGATIKVESANPRVKPIVAAADRNGQFGP